MTKVICWGMSLRFLGYTCLLGGLRFGHAFSAVCVCSWPLLSACSMEGNQNFLHLSTHRESLSHPQVGYAGSQRPGRERTWEKRKLQCAKQQMGKGDGSRWQLRRGRQGSEEQPVAGRERKAQVLLMQERRTWTGKRMREMKGLEKRRYRERTRYWNKNWKGKKVGAGGRSRRGESELR